MLDYRIEIIIFILLVILLTAVITPFMVNFFSDILPTNASLSVEDFLKKVVPKNMIYDYIQKDDYIFIVTYDIYQSLSSNIFAYKGKTSGYIPTSFSFMCGAKTRIRIKIIDGINISYYLVKHRDKYILNLSSFEADLILTDINGNKFDSILQGRNTSYFEVLEKVTEDYVIYGTIDDKKTFKVIDYNMIKKLLGE